MRKSFFLLSICVSLFLLSDAQDTHYWTQQFGSRSALMGGAVVGGSKDNTMIWYNPGALGFVDTGSVSVNASLYQIQNIKIKNAVGQEADFKSSQIGSVPLLLTGMLRAKNPLWKIGYGVVHPVSFNFKATARLDGFYNIADDAESPGNEEFIGQQSINTEVSEVTVVLSIARKLNEHWSIGYSNLFTARTQNYTKATLVRLFLNNADTALVSSTVLQSFSYFHLRYAGKFGVAYQSGNISAGLSVTTPGLKIMGSGSVAADITATNIKRNNQPRSDILADDRQAKLKTTFRSPVSVSAGLNINLHKSLLAFSAQYFGSESIYDNLRAKPSAFVRPASVYPDLESDDFLRVKTGAKSVFNMVVAYEYYAKESLTLNASIRNDMSYYDKQLINETGIKPDLTTWDIYHLSIGATIRRGRSSISTGLLFSTGNDTNHKQAGNLNNPSENNFLQGAVTVTQAKYSAIGLLLGYTYNFRKF